MKINTGFKQFLVAATLAVSPLLAWSAQAPEQLEQFIAQVKSATGDFTQQSLGQNGQGKPAQSGQFSFKRPGQFKWSVIKPYEQLIISDGKKVYQYDPDLAQVTERGVDQSIGASPAAILFGSGSLEEAFTISSLPSKDGFDWLRAQPRGANAGFTHVDIGFKDAMPARLELLDSFGQTTRIDLNNIVANPQLGADEFSFTPPAGVDVVKMQ
ncbi:outer membrane lipoprotein chaperone LolA [Pollutimonas harenae]|uniref:Outer-membrane lipoprotein carrier protein n=1 Tax=Pollutimonas harenae TaxID=657015 RepID=A0A853GXE5_9BURK|nr:outer membrane lipoprotein chaperone LolA [Pollutimonas harenae]NYT85426.1 outer membrane lipoprotein chaperone LolA [Pollutimonas harenae]TEA70520.1 outer membrane lipoprotein chaperone LolA [Pollutimonas harenae]